MRVALAMSLCCLGVTSCGYTVGATNTRGGARAIRVLPVEGRGIDIDTAALVGNAVRRSVAESPTTRLADEEAQAVLQVVVLDSTQGLAPMADPGLRAAQYVATLRIRGTLTSTAGETLWESPILRGQAPYLSVPDGLEALDGARRRAMAQAAAEAADELVASMVYGR